MSCGRLILCVAVSFSLPTAVPCTFRDCLVHIPQRNCEKNSDVPVSQVHEQSLAVVEDIKQTQFVVLRSQCNTPWCIACIFGSLKAGKIPVRCCAREGMFHTVGRDVCLPETDSGVMLIDTRHTELSTLENSSHSPP